MADEQEVEAVARAACVAFYGDPTMFDRMPDDARQIWLSVARKASCALDAHRAKVVCTERALLLALAEWRKEKP